MVNHFLEFEGVFLLQSIISSKTIDLMARNVFSGLKASNSILQIRIAEVLTLANHLRAITVHPCFISPMKLLLVCMKDE